MGSAKQLSENVEDLIQAVGQMEQSYKDLNTAMLSLPTVSDTDNVVRQRLMESILRRDMHVLLDALSGMKRTLVESVRTLIDSGEAALAAYGGHREPDDKSDASISHAEGELIRTLRLLKGVDQRLSSLESNY